MDGFVNKFLSVLKVVTDDNKEDVENKQETDGLKKENEGQNDVQENGRKDASRERQLNTEGILGETEPMESPQSGSSSNSSSNLQEDSSCSLLSYCPDDVPTLPRIEQCIDIVPVEDMPLPSPVSQLGSSTQSLEPGYTPSLAHSPSRGVLQRDRPPSPSLFDRSIEFFKREFDSIRFSLGMYAQSTEYIFCLFRNLFISRPKITQMKDNLIRMKFQNKVLRSKTLKSIANTSGTRPMLTHEEWFNIFNADGQMLDTEKFYSFLLDCE